MRNYSSILALGIVFACSATCAQDVTSGPDKGTKAPALKVYDVTGEHKNKEIDYAASRKDKPTVYAFIQSDKWDRPMARFLRKLEEAVKSDGEDNYVVAVWLTEKPDETKEYLPKAQQSLQFEVTALTCFTGDKSGPEEWHVNSMAHITIVVVNKKKVAATFGYMSINETDVPKVREALKKSRGES